MPIILRCPVTKTSIALAGFGESNLRITSPHPFMGLTASELAKVVEITSERDYHILLCAWLEQLSKIGVAHWLGALESANFTERWHEQQLEHVINMAQWLVHNSNHPALALIPHIRITHELTAENLQTWREQCQGILGSYSTFFEISETLRIRAQLEASERLLNEYAIDDSKLTTAVRKLRTRKAYLFNSLATHSNQEAVALVMKVCLNPQLYEVQTIQRTKEFCLDYCSEHGIDNANDKHELIQVLDAAIVDKIEMSALLGCATSAQDSDLLAGINAKYSIEIDGQTFLNGATPKVKQALQRSAGAGLIQDVTVRTYDSEPVRADYKSQLGYDIAHKQWSKQVRDGATTKQIIEAL